LSSEKSSPSTSTPRAEADLLVLGEEVLDVAVELQRPDLLRREDLLRPDLGVVERVEVQLGVVVVVHHLHEQLPLRVVAALDGVEQVLRRVPQVVGLDRRRVLLGHRGDAARRHEVVLDELRLALGVDPPVGVHAEPLLVAVVRGDAARAEEVHQHVHRLGGLRHEVEDPGRLLPERHGVRLERVDDVRELDRVPDEEDPEVAADEVPVAVLGVELDREAARVPGRLGGVPAPDHGREAQRDVGLLALLGEQLRARVVRDRLVPHFPVAVNVP
jgi:hypothetical protein